MPLIDSHAVAKKVLLVAPENSQGSFWDFSIALKLMGKKYNNPPLALLIIAAMLPRERYDVRLVDMNVTALPDEPLAWADVVFVSAMTIACKSMAEVLARAKAAGCVTVLGGPHPLTAYACISHVDCFVLGEAEALWEDFLADLDAGKLKNAYAAPVSSQEREAFLAYFGPQALIKEVGCPPDMNLVPVPRYDLLDMKVYHTMALQTSRGCPSNCEFCDVWRRFGRKPRNRAPENVLADLSELYRQGWRGNVLFADDNLIGNKVYARTLLTAIARWQVEHRHPFNFWAEGSLNLAEDIKLLELFAAVKLNSLFVGIETPCRESLSEANKYVNLAGDIVDRVATLQAHGIQVVAGFIVGFDADPADIAERMPAAIQEMGIPIAMTNILMAVPNSDLNDRMAREGRLFEGLMNRYNNGHIFMTNFRTARPVGEVMASYRNVLQALYPEDMKSYFERCNTFFERRLTKRRKLQQILADIVPDAKPVVGPPPASGATAESAKAQPLNKMISTFKQLRQLSRVLGQIMFRPHAWNALRFLIAIWRNRPAYFARAFSCVVVGHHFWMITRSYVQAAELWDCMKERLEFVYATSGLDFPQSTNLLCTWRPQTEMQDTAESIQTLESFSESGTERATAARLNRHQAEQLKTSILKEVERKYRRLGRVSQSMVEGEYDLFCKDIDSWAALCGEPA